MDQKGLPCTTLGPALIPHLFLGKILKSSYFKGPVEHPHT